MKSTHPTESNPGGTQSSAGDETSRSQKEGAKMQQRQERSPDQVHDQAKQAVSRGLAAASGVLEGFVERMREDHMADKASDSIHQAGEVTVKVTQATREEANRIQSEVRQVSHDIGGSSEQGTLPSHDTEPRERTNAGAGGQPEAASRSPLRRSSR